MPKLIPHCVALALALTLVAPTASMAQEPGTLAEETSPRLLFVVSGGFWQTIEQAEATESETEGEAEAGGEDDAAVEAPAEPDERGYYRLMAFRSDDNSSRLYLQRIMLGETGPELLDTTEVTDVTERAGFITDIRPENSTGVSSTPGFAAFIYIKETPDAAEPDMLELFVDEFGDLTVDGASN